jgi:hypothetical protein
MAEHENLDVLCGAAASQQGQPADDPAEDQIEQTYRRSRRGCPIPITASTNTSTSITPGHSLESSIDTFRVGAAGHALDS